MLKSTYAFSLEFLCLFLSLCCGCPSLNAQDNNRTVTGKVTEDLSGDPIPAASVFINNSTYVRICDAQGAFVLDRFPPPPFELTVTAVGYKTASIGITAETLKKPLQIRLLQKNIGLEEVTIVSPEKNGWQKYGQLFRDKFIGYSSFARQCDLLNKEVLEFRYDKKDNILHVSATAPLLIRNNATGYLVTFWMDDFEYRFGSNLLYFKGYSQFAPLQSDKEKKNRQWAANRLSAYKGSLNHFMRSVYQNNTSAEGFVIRRMKRISAEEYGLYVPVRTDTIPVATQAGKEVLIRRVMIDTADRKKAMGQIIGILQWLKDDNQVLPYRFALDPRPPDTVATREYRLMKDLSGKKQVIASLFDKNRPSPGDSTRQSLVDKGVFTVTRGTLPRDTRRYDIVDPMVIPSDSIASRQSNGVTLHFTDYLYIIYPGEEEEDDYKERQYEKGPIPLHAPQTSIISITPGESLQVMENGNFYNGYDLLTEQYWSYEKMDKFLPLDYMPPVTVPENR